LGCGARHPHHASQGGSDTSWPSVEDVAETVRTLDATSADIDRLKAALKDVGVDPEVFK